MEALAVAPEASEAVAAAALLRVSFNDNFSELWAGSD